MYRKYEYNYVKTLHNMQLLALLYTNIMSRWHIKL